MVRIYDKPNAFSTAKSSGSLNVSAVYMGNPTLQSVGTGQTNANQAKTAVLASTVGGAVV